MGHRQPPGVVTTSVAVVDLHRAAAGMSDGQVVASQSHHLTESALGGRGGRQEFSGLAPSSGAPRVALIHEHLAGVEEEKRRPDRHCVAR